LAGTNAILNSGDEYDFVKWGISTIVVKAGCSLETFEVPYYQGGKWAWEADLTDQTYNTWEVSATTGRVMPDGTTLPTFNWNDMVRSYKCACAVPGMKNRKIFPVHNTIVKVGFFRCKI